MHCLQADYHRTSFGRALLDFCGYMLCSGWDAGIHSDLSKLCPCSLLLFLDAHAAGMASFDPPSFSSLVMLMKEELLTVKRCFTTN